MRRPTEVTSFGVSSSHSRQAFSTSDARSTGEEEDAGVDLRDRVERELHRRDDAEAAAAAADRPEELGLVVAVGADEASVGGHELDGRDAVRGQAVAAREPAEAAAERVADHADVRRGAGEAREAVLGRGEGDLLPQHAGLGARGLGLRVDLEPAHAARADENRVVEGLQGVGEVAGALSRHAHAAPPGVLDHGDDVVGGLGEDDRRGPLVGGQVPRLARGVPVGFAREDDLAVEQVAENADAGCLLCGRDRGAGHRKSSVLVGSVVGRASLSHRPGQAEMRTPSVWRCGYPHGAERDRRA